MLRTVSMADTMGYLREACKRSTTIITLTSFLVSQSLRLLVPVLVVSLSRVPA